MRMNVLRPVGSGHVPVPLGASRSDHLLTPQTRQRSNGSADRGQNFHQQKMPINFRPLAPGRKEDCARGSGPRPRGRRVNQGATETAQTIVSPAPSLQALSRLPPLSLLTPDPFPAPGRGVSSECAARVTCNHHQPEHDATHPIGSQRFEPSAPRRPPPPPPPTPPPP